MYCPNCYTSNKTVEFLLTNERAQMTEMLIVSPMFGGRNKNIYILSIGPDEEIT
jgi:hypothetical protein